MFNQLGGAAGSIMTQQQALAQQSAMNQAQQGYGMSAGPMGQQQSLANAYAAQQALNRWDAKWVINGEIMKFDEFVNKIFPEDCKEKTWFLLKYNPQGELND